MKLARPRTCRIIPSLAKRAPGSGLRFDWDIYNNPDTPPSPQINVRAGGERDGRPREGYTIAGITTSGSDPSTWWTHV